MNIRKITEDEIRENSVASLATRPNEGAGYGKNGLSADELKAAFDALGRLNAMRYNELVDALQSGELGTGNAGGDTGSDTGSDTGDGESVGTGTGGTVSEETLAALREELANIIAQHADEKTAHRGMTEVALDALSANTAATLVQFEDGTLPTASCDGDMLSVNTGAAQLGVTYANGTATIGEGVSLGSVGLYVPIATVPVVSGETYAFYVKESFACTETERDLVLSVNGTKLSLYELFATLTEKDVDTNFPIVLTANADTTAVLYWHLRLDTTTEAGISLTPVVYRLQSESVYKIEDGGENRVTALYGHAFGHKNTASGYASYAAGDYNTASGICSVACGRKNVAADYSHAEGYGTQATGTYAHAENCNTVAAAKYSHAEGHGSEAYVNEEENVAADYSHAEGYGSMTMAKYAHAEGYQCTASGNASHAQNYNTTASGSYSHAQGRDTTASGYASLAMGNNSTAAGSYAIAGGVGNTAYAAGSIAMGNGCNTSGRYSYVNGTSSNANGTGSVAIGNSSAASGDYSLAIGDNNTAIGDYSVARGKESKATGTYSFVHGSYLVAPSNNQVAFGRYNIEDVNALFQIGGGTNVARKDLFAVRNTDGVLSILLGDTEITETQLKALLTLAATASET